MRSSDLVDALAIKIPRVLADDVVSEFLSLRHDVATETLGRSAPGKFVETVVQILQYLETSNYDAPPDVDRYLRGLESRASALDDGLRICASRIVRAMYALRSKRNIVHKGEVDPNSFDLRFLLAGAQWVLAELLRTTSGASMEAAGEMIARVQAPVGALVEDFGTRRLTVAGLSARAELLLLLSDAYPTALTLDELAKSADRIARRTVSNTVRALWRARLVEGSSSDGYKLTRAGLAEAGRIAADAIDEQKS